MFKTFRFRSVSETMDKSIGRVRYYDTTGTKVSEYYAYPKGTLTELKTIKRTFNRGSDWSFWIGVASVFVCRTSLCLVPLTIGLVTSAHLSHESLIVDAIIGNEYSIDDLPFDPSRCKNLSLRNKGNEWFGDCYWVHRWEPHPNSEELYPEGEK